MAYNFTISPVQWFKNYKHCFTDNLKKCKCVATNQNIKTPKFKT